jgi:conjugal transfer pilus assembly protein TraD
LIDLLNKGREAHFNLTMAVQTLGDIESRLGSRAKTEMVLGNMSYMIFGRCTAPDSREFFVSRAPQVILEGVRYSNSVSTPHREPLSFATSDGESLESVKQPVIEPDIIGSLPDFEWFATLGGDRFVKGRSPVLVLDE